jgi:hypothetical protein
MPKSAPVAARLSGEFVQNPMMGPSASITSGAAPASTHHLRRGMLNNGENIFAEIKEPRRRPK